MSAVAEIDPGGRDVVEAGLGWRPGSVVQAVAFADLHVACLSVLLVGVEARALAVAALS